MSLPPLPEVFGNYALKNFTEISSPAPVSWLPQTEGWLYLAVLMLAGLAWRAWLWLKHWHHNRYRREALRELECLKPDSRELNFVAALNALLKRTALAVYPRQRVAALNGQEWIAFLQGECDAQAFDNSSAALLAQGSYKIEPIAEDQAQALLAAAARWIREHRGVER